MKKLHIVLIGLLLITGLVRNLNAENGSHSDARVEYIYWDQNSTQTYWTGVTNKTGNNDYAPCVARIEDIWNCGEYAYKSQYKEFGTWLDTDGDNFLHGHSLKNRWNGYDYLIPDWSN